MVSFLGFLEKVKLIRLYVFNFFSQFNDAVTQLTVYLLINVLKEHDGVRESFSRMRTVRHWDSNREPYRLGF